MMIIRLATPISLAILLSSCATTANYYPQTVHSWQNGKATELVRAWGVPDEKVVLSNGHQVYVYKTETYKSGNATYTPQIVLAVRDGHPFLTEKPNKNFATRRPGPQVTCVTMFEADKKGTIVQTQTKGSNCSAGVRFAPART